MSKPKATITSITIQLTEYEPISFTMVEAKELYEQLHELFADKTKETHHYHPLYEPWYQRPWVSWSGASASVNQLIGDVETHQDYLNLIADTKAVSNETGMVVSYNAEPEQ